MQNSTSFFYQKIQLRVSFRLWKVLYGALSILAGAYLLWEVYWWRLVGYVTVKWHTHIGLYLILWVGVSGLLLLFAPKQMRAKLLISSSSILGTMLLFEVLLMWSGGTKTYMENRSGEYQSVFNYSASGKVYAYPPNSTHQLNAPEYSYQRNSNADGLSDKNFVADSTKVIVQTYGDSFTEGDGAPSDSAYPALLGHLLGDSFTVQNFGLCGNDPGYYGRQFAEIGIKYTPQIAIMCYSSGDFLIDFFSRGGLRRYQNDGLFRQAPWWEPLYAMSYLSRYFFHAIGYEYGNFFMRPEQIEEEVEKLKPEWNNVFIELAELAKSKGCSILLLKKPEKAEIQDNRYDFDFTFFETMADTLPAFRRYDLLPYYRNVAGLTDPQSINRVYWVIDGHHNSTGYHIMAHGVFEGIKQCYLQEK